MSNREGFREGPLELGHEDGQGFARRSREEDFFGQRG